MFSRFSRHGADAGPTPPAQDAFEAARRAMVQTQLASRGIRSPEVLEAMRNVPRHLFIPDHLRARAYEDHPLDIGNAQTISQPFMVAAMTQLLELKSTDRVLEIGTGSGYQTAVLASLAGHVTSVERIDVLAETALDILTRLGYRNVEVHIGDGTLGWPLGAPYDAIIVTAAGPSVPRSLVAQLNDRGRLICPVGTREAQRLVRIVRYGEGYREDEGIGCVFVPLIGAEGWPN